MQVFGLPRHVIRNGCTASRVAAQSCSEETRKREAAVLRWRQAMADGLTAEQAAHAVGATRSTLYRWEDRPEPQSRRPTTTRKRNWPPALLEAIKRLRDDFPMWGKAKLGPLLRLEGFAVSDSTVGRILAWLVEKGRIIPVPTLRRRPKAQRRSVPGRPHARRLPKGHKPLKPGEIVQIDTVFINPEPGKSIKHFTAYCPVAKWTVGKAVNRATARSARAFLDKVIADMPFTVKAIQVDGGSEFRAEFEQACADKGLTLFELPPKRPQLNGAVERCNGAWRYEFYSVYDLEPSVEAINPILNAFQNIYNKHRPHGALDGMTPMQYLKSNWANEISQSHMS